jgi:RimJ/RimL family protein N-acetyltransferase
LKLRSENRHIDLGYRLFQRFWGKGLGCESAQAALSYGIERLGVTTIYGFSHASNTGSVRVLQKCGLRFDGKEIEDGREWQRFVYHSK